MTPIAADRTVTTQPSRDRRLTALAAALARIGLPAWFVAVDVVFASAFFDPRGLLGDSRLYQEATLVWLAGGDPWVLGEYGVTYASGPWSLLAYLPTAWLPLESSAWLWAGLGVIAALWTLRRLELPLWWLAFPPLATALWTGTLSPWSSPRCWCGRRGAWRWRAA